MSNAQGAMTVFLCGLAFASVEARAAEPLILEARITLGDISGRIDRLAYDSKHGRIIIAELGNNSVSIADPDQREVLRRITGLNTPQGVAYSAATDMIYVASAGDGLVRRYKGADLTEIASIDLNDDCDSIHVDPTTNQVIVGYGLGGLAVLGDAVTEKPPDASDASAKITYRSPLSDSKGGPPSNGLPKVKDKIKGTSAVYTLPAHPEGFQIDPRGQRIFVNLASLGEVGVVDRASGKLVATWGVPGLGSNFPMAIDQDGQRLFVVYRHPSRLAVFATDSGKVAATSDLCGDPDDIFPDTRRRRLYVTCGVAVVDVLEQDGTGYRRVGRVASGLGARTGLFVPERDRLYVAVPAADGQPAAVLVFRPTD